MADDTDDGTTTQQLQPGVTVTRAPGQIPVRKDSRGLLGMLADELNKYHGKEPLHQGKTVDEVVNDAVGSAKGASPEY